MLPEPHFIIKWNYAWNKWKLTLCPWHVQCQRRYPECISWMSWEWECVSKLGTGLTVRPTQPCRFSFTHGQAHAVSKVPRLLICYWCQRDTDMDFILISHWSNTESVCTEGQSMSACLISDIRWNLWSGIMHMSSWHCRPKRNQTFVKVNSHHLNVFVPPINANSCPKLCQR